VPGDAVGFAQRVDRVAVQIGYCFAHYLVGGTTIELHVAGECHNVGTRLFQRLAHIHRLDRREIVNTGRDKLADPGQDASAFDCRHAAPGTAPGLPGGFDGGINVRLIAACDDTDLLAGRRILQRQPFTRVRRLPPSCDEALVGFEPQTAQCHGSVPLLLEGPRPREVPGGAAVVQ
jgi:hypothetical protein